jgi:hypothetical protein
LGRNANFVQNKAKVPYNQRFLIITVAKNKTPQIRLRLDKVNDLTRNKKWAINKSITTYYNDRVGPETQYTTCCKNEKYVKEMSQC